MLSSSTFAMPCASSCVPSTSLRLTGRIERADRLPGRLVGGVRQSPRQRPDPRPLLGKRSLILDKHQRVETLIAKLSRFRKDELHGQTKGPKPRQEDRSSQQRQQKLGSGKRPTRRIPSRPRDSKVAATRKQTSEASQAPAGEETAGSTNELLRCWQTPRLDRVRRTLEEIVPTPRLP